MHLPSTQEEQSWASEWFGTTDSPLRKVLGIILLVAGAGVLCPFTNAQTPVVPQKLTAWFCSSIDGSFDFPKLTKTFPFGQLGDVTTNRTPVRAHVTTERDCNGKSVGIVDNGLPIPTKRIAADLRRSREATLANMEKLAAGDYIDRSADAGHAYRYRVRILLEESRD